MMDRLAMNRLENVLFVADRDRATTAIVGAADLRALLAAMKDLCGELTDALAAHEKCRGDIEALHDQLWDMIDQKEELEYQLALRSEEKRNAINR